MSFDTLFIVQHYILYRDSNGGKSGTREGIEDSDEHAEADETTPLV